MINLITSVLSTAYISVMTLFKGRLVGKDGSGNRYYVGKARKGYKRERRWVIYDGAPEATKVPPEWHGWLHHQTDELPTEKNTNYRRKWQKEHRPNRTGSSDAYRPPGHILEGGVRDKATGDYEAWQPNQ